MHTVSSSVATNFGVQNEGCWVCFCCCGFGFGFLVTRINLEFCSLDNRCLQDYIIKAFQQYLPSISSVRLSSFVQFVHLNLHQELSDSKELISSQKITTP